MSFAELKEKLKPAKNIYVYSVNFDKKIVQEYCVSEKATIPKEFYQNFPYEECGFEDPYALLYSPDWTCYAEDGTIITDEEAIKEEA